MAQVQRRWAERGSENPRWHRHAWHLIQVQCLALALCGLAQARNLSAEIEQIESTLRGRPEEALAALDRLLPVADGAASIEALLLKGTLLNRKGQAAAAEQVAQELDRRAAAAVPPSPAGDPVAAAAASLLRAQMLARSGPAARAERLLTAAAARLPPDTPARLRVRYLDEQAALKQSLGQLDQAVELYQSSVLLADQLAIPWLSAAQRGSLAYALLRAHQADRALLINQEAMQLAVKAGKALVRQALVLEENAGALTEMLGIQEELGHALEKAGLLTEAWQALTEHRRLADEVFQRKHQQAVLELQEGFDADRRQRELDALLIENGLKEAVLLQRDLEQRLWIAGITFGVLLLAVAGVLLRRMRHINAQLQSSNALLKVASERDPLTGLANRRHLMAVMERSATAGQGFDGSMLLIDIDHFKRINDQHGHAAGDQVLVETAQRLRQALREQDLTVRWGGEEFLVVVHAMPADEVEALAQRLLAAIGREPVLLGRLPISVSASIGFATFPLQPLRRALTWEKAIDRVDTAMYLAKAHGRNRAYGVRALQDEDGALVTAQPGTLENAWRSGRADLTHLSGPVPAPSAA
jgi:diguanylate cyclase (GGDEF)-like protein